MQLNMTKLDERIRKLQEIRRIAADPELVTMLLEFIASDDELKEGATAIRTNSANALPMDDVDLVNRVVSGIEPHSITISSGKRT